MLEVFVLIINIPVQQTYRVVPLYEFIDFVNSKYGKSFVLQNVKFVLDGEYESERQVLASREDIDFVELSSEFPHQQTIHFLCGSKKTVGNRQDNSVCLDVKYLEEKDVVATKTKHYDISDWFPHTSIITIKKTLSINPEKYPELLYDAIKSKTGLSVSEYIYEPNETYTFNSKKLKIEDKNIPINENGYLSCGQLELFIVGSSCLICNSKNKVCI